MQWTNSPPTALPLPKRLRIESAEPRKKLWEKLEKKQQKLALYLLEAGRAGRLLLFYQSHRHSFALKQFFEKAFNQKNIRKTQKMLGEEAFQELLLYAAKFLDQAGPYSNSNRKYYLQTVSAESLGKLLRQMAPSLPPKTRKEMLLLLTDPMFEAQCFPESSDGDRLEVCGGNLYAAGIRGKDVRASLNAGLEIRLNQRVVKKGKKLSCETHTTKSKGMVGKTLRSIVQSLKSAQKLAPTEWQKKEFEHLIHYFQTGNIEAFRQANIAWVKDRDHSVIDFMIGWVEVYEDWLARIGSWESYVQIVDPEIGKLATRLAAHAQYFENAMPYEECFKKRFPPDYSPPAIMVYFFQERSTYRAAGYNLPNFDDIRRDYGAKNVIKLPMPGEDLDADYRAVWEEALAEFLPADKIHVVLQNREKLWRVLVLLHEIIGHGSGTYDVTEYGPNQDPISALGPLGSAMEEQRADLTALVFAGDSTLIQSGLYKNESEAKSIRNATYDFVLADFLRRLSGQRTFTEAHQRGHWLFIRKLLEQKAIGWVSKVRNQPMTLENQVLAVLDYDLFYQVAYELLGELQDIKARHKEIELKELFEKYSPLEAAEEPWAKAIVQRGKDLLINAGFVEQPWKVSATGKFTSLGGHSLEEIAPFWAESF